MIPLQIRIRRGPAAEAPEALPLPARASSGASGFDLCAAVRAPLVLEPGARALVPIGYSFEIPEGWEAQVRARSGLALRHGVMVLNGPGTVDADYRGEVAVLLANLGEAHFTVRRGDRVAQLVFCPVPPVVLVEVDALGDTARGVGGFGSTGVSAPAKGPSKPEV